jgi:hypothetical protein
MPAPASSTGSKSRSRDMPFAATTPYSVRCARIALTCAVRCEADDVVLVEIGTGLHFDDVQRDLAWVFRPVRSSSSPRRMRAVPCTTTQCSARWWCICIGPVMSSGAFNHPQKAAAMSSAVGFLSTPHL